jgi:hypothetical protein
VATLRISEEKGQHVLETIAEMPLDRRITFGELVSCADGAKKTAVFVNLITGSSWFVDE